MTFDPKVILSAWFELHDASLLRITPITDGLINHSYRVDWNDDAYLLQHINTQVFPDPELLCRNAQRLNDCLITGQSHWLAPQLIPSRSKHLFHRDATGRYWRLFPFVPNCRTFHVATNHLMVERAAEAIGRFHQLTARLDPADFGDPLPGFLDFSARLQNYRQALNQANDKVLQRAADEIRRVNELLALPDRWIRSVQNGSYPLRLIHGDPKLSNLLFDASGEQVLAVIDLDTVMAGPQLYDFGDMVRAYCNRLPEDDDRLMASFDSGFYQALHNGYLRVMDSDLQAAERADLTYAAQVVIFIQAVRFLTDFLQGNVYYQVSDPLQNLRRTRNQLHLLTQIRRETA